MNRTKFFSHRIIVSSLLVLLMSSCNLSNIKIGDVRMMFGSNEEGHISYTFSTFTGFERGSVQAEAGQYINFKYQANVDQGSLNIEWQDSAGEAIWQKSTSGSVDGQDDIKIESPGEFTIIVQGKNAAGDFDVSWDVE